MDSALPLGSIVVGIDGSDHSHDAVRWATREAGIQKRTLVIATATGRPRQLSTRSWGTHGNERTG
ncbi:MAG: universal stress protein [Nocardioidaceae bacterium]|nr:MAG: universal stress protein [Nocardioidaceae bacterium]